VKPHLPAAVAAKVARPAGPPKLASKLPPTLPPGAGGGPRPKAKSGVERVKEESAGLRGTLAEQLRSGADHFDEAGKQLIKFHGSYQQDDRDARSGGKRYQFMVRSKLPGGRLTADQYLVHDDLADRYGDGTLRITTRQGFQLYGVVMGDLKATIRAVNEALVTTLGACGDVVRNVVCCPAPHGGVLHEAVAEATRALSDHFLPRSGA